MEEVHSKDNSGCHSSTCSFTRSLRDTKRLAIKILQKRYPAVDIRMTKNWLLAAHYSGHFSTCPTVALFLETAHKELHKKRAAQSKTQAGIGHQEILQNCMPLTQMLITPHDRKVQTEGSTASCPPYVVHILGGALVNTWPELTSITTGSDVQ